MDEQIRTFAPTRRPDTHYKQRIIRHLQLAQNLLTRSFCAKLVDLNRSMNSFNALRYHPMLRYQVAARGLRARYKALSLPKQVLQRLPGKSLEIKLQLMNVSQYRNLRRQKFDGS